MSLGPAVVSGRKRLLVACHDVVLSGGLLRFDRIASVLARDGHEVCFVAPAGAGRRDRPTDLEVLSFDEAARSTWDAVMVPGAGFPAETIGGFSAFRDERFGTRVQHVLNDQSRCPSFRLVNDHFAPHVVIFNNEHWPPGSFTDFQADRFHFLVGAVDVDAFRPWPGFERASRRWVVGGLANKNPDPLVEALDDLDPDVTVRLFGHAPGHFAERHRRKIETGRLELVGPIHGRDLERFYRDVDCVAMTETIAGWSNLAAEAMASGVPLICTPHGTLSFARDDDTALVLDEPTPRDLVHAISRLRADPALGNRLAERGRTVIERFSWTSYCQQLLPLLTGDGRKHYYHDPDLGLHGKWPSGQRLSGLAAVLKAAPGASVADFGAAEGIVSRAFLERGARLVHAFEIDPSRVEAARLLCGQVGPCEVRQADLSDWTAFQERQSSLLRTQYDIVLYLGIHQHLPAVSRMNSLTAAARLARRFFALRTPQHVYDADRIDGALQSVGFRLLDRTPEMQDLTHLGPCMIYENEGRFRVGPA